MDVVGKWCCGWIEDDDDSQVVRWDGSLKTS